MKKAILWGLVDAAGVGIYITVVSLIMQNAERFFDKEDSCLSPVVFLLLFVLSASITGFLVFGRPVMMYLDNKRNEAVKVVGFTLGWLFVFFLIFAVILAWR